MKSSFGGSYTLPFLSLVVATSILMCISLTILIYILYVEYIYYISEYKHIVFLYCIKVDCDICIIL